MNLPTLPLFLYLKKSTVDKATLAAVRKAGWMPIGVDSFDDVRTVCPLRSSDIVAKTAFKAIASDDSAFGPQARFGSMLSKELAK